jgi:AraC-like DNA-binding protein
VASAAGFGSVDVMRRAFVRLLGITPRRYRELAEHPIREWEVFFAGFAIFAFNLIRSHALYDPRQLVVATMC